MGLPAVAAAGPVLVTARSTDLAAALTWVDADAVLLAALGSGSLPPMVAVLVMVPAVAGAVALIVIVALAPDASEPTPQVTVPEALVQVPWVEVAEPKPTPEGRVSVTVAPVVAVAGPVLVTPRSTDLAAALTWVDADAVLLAGVGSGSLPPIVAVLTMVPAVAGAVAPVAASGPLFLAVRV